MRQDLIDEIIRTLALFAIEAYEYEDQPPEAVVKNFHSINVGTLRRARDMVKELEQLREKRPFILHGNVSGKLD